MKGGYFNLTNNYTKFKDIIAKWKKICYNRRWNNIGEQETNTLLKPSQDIVFQALFGTRGSEKILKMHILYGSYQKKEIWV